MSSFPEALDYVHRALSDLQARGAKCCASTQALAALAAAGPAPAERSSVAPNLAPPPAETPRPAATSAPVSRVPAPVAPDAPSVPVLPKLKPRPSAPARPGSKAERLAALHDSLRNCVKCEHLAKSRTQVVFGVGNPEAELMFVGEAPGEDEDHEGEPFVGKAGQLLTKIIQAMGFDREQVYIANVLKCRPDIPPGASGNRKPNASEMQTCLPYLREQIEIVQPRVLVALGSTAMEGLLGATEPMGRLRGRWHDFHGTPLMATYHPAYLLRNQSLSEKRKVWEDMLLVLERLGTPISEKQRGFFLPKA
jgi:DNA polymerase